MTKQNVGAYDEEYRIVRPDGQVRWIRDRAFPVRNAAGQVVRMVGVARDITERKQANMALRASEERFRLLIENAPDMIHVINNAGVLRYQSPSAKQILGYESEERLGKKALELVHPDDVGQVQAALQQAVAHPGRPVRIEYRLRHKNGDWRVLQTVGRSLPELAEEGFIVLNSRDISEQRRLEEQLRQSQKLEAIGQLAGGVAHDFNNILAVILMQSELITKRGGLPEPAREGIQQIRAAAERAANFTRQLLLFSRRQVMQPRDLDLNEVVTNLAKMLRRIIGEDVHLELHLHPAPLMTRADAGMLEQVLLNLAVNARDAMPEGGRLIIETTTREFTAEEAAALPDAQPGRYVGLRVSDTGCGIPPEILPRIFEPFFTTKEPGKGTGLGLATVFGIVKQHGGCLQVASEPGRGTTFEVFLPALAETAAAASATASRPAPRGGTETLLLVEDDSEVRALTRATLERHGYRVLEAPDGLAAIELWRQHCEAVALLLTDLVMPGGLNGRDLARRLRADRPQLKVIYTSGYSAELAGRELNPGPGEAFLQKPSAPELLLETVRRCLDATADAPPA